MSLDVGDDTLNQYEQMRELLNDAVDLVTDYGDDGGDKVAMMLWSKNEDRKGEKNVTSGTSKLPLVNLETDPRLFAVHDEGCNATVHTPAWAKAANQAWSIALIPWEFVSPEANM